MTVAHRLSLERKFFLQESLKIQADEQGVMLPFRLGWLITDAWLFSFLQHFCVSHKLVLTKNGPLHISIHTVKKRLIVWG